MDATTAGFKPGDRVVSIVNLGLIRDDGPQSRFAGTAKASMVGTVLDMDLGIPEAGWVAVRFDDIPEIDGDAVYAPAGADHIVALDR